MRVADVILIPTLCSNERSPCSVLTGGALAEEPTRRERVTQCRLDLRANLRISVTHPGDVRVDIQRRVQRLAMLVGHEDPKLAGDQLRAEIVWMAADAEREPPAREQRLHQRTQVGDEPIVSGDQLVQLSAGRDVLILEAVRLAGTDRAERGLHDLIVDRSQLGARAWKEARNHREAVRDRGGARGPQRERLAFARQSIETLRARAGAAQRPRGVAEV